MDRIPPKKRPYGQTPNDARRFVPTKRPRPDLLAQPLNDLDNVDKEAGDGLDSDTEEDFVPPASKDGARYAQKRPQTSLVKETAASQRAKPGDDEVDDEDDDEVDDEEMDDEDEEDDDDEDEDEDEEEAADGRKKKARRPVNPFIQEEAEDVDEDDEDEDEDDEGLDQEFLEEEEAEEALKLQPEIYRSLDRRRDQDDSFDAERITERLKQQYQGAYTDSYTVSTYQGDAQHVPSQFLNPVVGDPSLWLVRCKPGRERIIAMNLLRKSMDLMESPERLRIFSVVARSSLKGYIYVEARSMEDVQRAIQNMNGTYVSKITLVPMNEMVDVMTIQRKELDLKPGAWVRLTRGKYKGDLAQVVEVSENNESIRVKLIPRLDYTFKSDLEKKKKNVTGFRPPQRFFNKRDIDPRDRSLARSHGYYIWNGDMFDKRGFLEKDVKMAGVEHENVQPSLDEIAKFSSGNNAGEDGETGQGFSMGNQMNMLALAETVKREQADDVDHFRIGELLTVTEGELVNAQGVVDSIQPGRIMLRMKNEALGIVPVLPGQVSKSYQVGDHVRVFRGKFKDENGMITQVKGNVVVVFSDSTMKQFEVFLRDVQGVGEVAIMDRNEHSYSLHEFVQIGPMTVGVVIKVEKDMYKVLDQNGVVRNVTASDISQRRDTRRVISMDANQNTIQASDKVEVLAGEYMKKQATILHLFRTWAFLLDPDMTETSGVFVVRTRMISKLSARQQNSPSVTTTTGFRVPVGQPMRRDPLLFKTVSITQGPYKGYQGVVKSVSAKGARIELTTSGKIVNSDPGKLKVLGSRSGETVRTGSAGRFHGGMTPALGARTPNPYAGSQTPNRDGGRTPAWDSGSRTPAWDVGSKTPAWDSGSRTPAWDVGSKAPAWDSGSRTPAWDSGSRTPAIHSSSSARESNSYPSAPRPAATSARKPAIQSSSGWDDDAVSKTTNETSTREVLTPAYGRGETPYQAPTPYTPMAVSTPYGHSAPTRDPSEAEGTRDWIREGMEVKIQSGSLKEVSQGVVKRVLGGGKCEVNHLGEEDSRLVTLPTTSLSPAPPNKKDSCIFLIGHELAGEKGQLIGMDGTDAIVKLNSSGEFKITPLSAICKLTTS